MKQVYLVRCRIPGQWADTLEYPVASSPELAAQVVRGRYPGVEILSISVG